MSLDECGLGREMRPSPPRKRSLSRRDNQPPVAGPGRGPVRTVDGDKHTAPCHAAAHPTSAARQRDRTGPRLVVGLIPATNFTLSALSLFVDVLRLAADEGDRSRPIGCRWEIISSETSIRSSCGVSIARTSPLIDPSQFDYIAVVGGVLHAGRQVDDATVSYLRQAAAAGVPLVGLCTGSFILARSGLMDGRACCVSWFHYGDFRAEFPECKAVADHLFVIDGDRITCSGGSGVADLAAYLIERHVGGSSAQKSLHILLLDQARRGTDAQPHPRVENYVGDERVSRALLLMEQNMSSPLKVGILARRLDISSRQLERLFQATMGDRPGRVYRGLRLRYAMWLLRNTNRSITEIAIESGFADGAHFSRNFKQMFNITPSEVTRPAQSMRTPADAGTNLRRSAVSDLHSSLGAGFSPFAGSGDSQPDFVQEHTVKEPLS